MSDERRENAASGSRWLSVAMVVLLVLSAMAWSLAQDSSSKPQQQVPGAGGPQGDIGPYSIPKKKDEPPPERSVRPPKNPAEIGTFSITKTVDLVNVDVLVTTKEGQFIPGLKKENFRVLEDGVPQQVNTFTQSKDAPITAVLLVEFANTSYGFMMDALRASYTFAEQLKPNDWIAVVYYDMKPYMLTDFTQDKRAVYSALDQLRIPGFSETNLFDALYDTLDRVQGVEGRKYIILVSSGRDTFSKLNYDKILKYVQGTQDTTIFGISTGWALRNWYEAHTVGNFDANVAMLNYYQADNMMKTFAGLTGGRAYFPRMEGDFPEAFQDIGASIRNQYVLSYHSSNQKRDGSYRKLKVELVDPQTGGPLKVVNQKGKSLKYNIIARDGYKAKHEVE